MNTSNNLKALLSIFLLCTALNANSLPITGELGIGGNFIPVDIDWNPTTTAAATGVMFDPEQFIVNSATGDFTGVSTVGNIQSFQFDTFSGPIPGFWSIDDFSFELTSVSREFTNNPDTFLALNGTGTISSTGFDDTVGTWSLTGDTTNGDTFSWSSGTTTAGATVSAPAPGIAALLGIGLVGLGIRRLKID